MDIVLLILSHLFAIYFGMVLFVILLLALEDSAYYAPNPILSRDEFHYLKHAAVSLQLFVKSYGDRLFK